MFKRGDGGGGSKWVLVTYCARDKIGRGGEVEDAAIHGTESRANWGVKIRLQASFLQAPSSHTGMEGRTARTGEESRCVSHIPSHIPGHWGQQSARGEGVGVEQRMWNWREGILTKIGVAFQNTFENRQCRSMRRQNRQRASPPGCTSHCSQLSSHLWIVIVADIIDAGSPHTCAWRSLDCHTIGIS